MDWDPHSKESYDGAYRGQFPGGRPGQAPPWHLDDAQPRIKELAALGVLRGDIADIGCGLGSSAIYLGRHGYSVTGLDSSPAAIQQAAQRAEAAGVDVTFAVADATELAEYEGAFDTVLETGLMHSLDTAARRDYARAVYRAARSGARWFIYCFSTHTVNGVPSNLGVDEDEIRELLAEAGWTIEYFGTGTYEFDFDTYAPIAMWAGQPDETDFPDSVRRLRAILPLIPNGEPVYVPAWVIYARRS